MLIDVLEQNSALRVISLLRVVAEVPQTIGHRSYHFDRLLAVLLMHVHNFGEDLVDVVGITALHRNLESLRVLLCLQQERNFLDDLGFQFNQEI